MINLTTWDNARSTVGRTVAALFNRVHGADNTYYDLLAKAVTSAFVQDSGSAFLIKPVFSDFGLGVLAVRL